MQFTGLKDRYGTEIYEGDVLSLRSDGEWHKYIVTYNKDRFQLKHTNKTWIKPLINKSKNTGNLKVIGNIYEHSKLFDLL